MVGEHLKITAVCQADLRNVEMPSSLCSSKQDETLREEDKHKQMKKESWRLSQPTERLEVQDSEHLL